MRIILAAKVPRVTFHDVFFVEKFAATHHGAFHTYSDQCESFYHQQIPSLARNYNQHRSR